MASNIDRFKKDLERLISGGRLLELAMQPDVAPETTEAQIRNALGEKTDEYIKKLPDFNGKYQRWYSEARAVVKQILPDRVADFSRHYEKPKGRKDITFENYHIEDYLQGLRVTRFGSELIVDKSAALPRFRQQIAILESAEQRFVTSLFDIRQVVQADLLDSEVDAARELLKHRFTRAAGAVAGVVLEKHLAQVCENHQVAVTKRNPSIADLNDALKTAEVIETAQWRFIQHLGDIRNLCDHNKKTDPTQDQVEDLINGVAKVIKTTF